MRRHLRFAPTVAFALLALAFVGLWMRSYWSHDVVTGPVGGSDLCLASDRGVVLVGVLAYDPGLGWELRHYPAIGVQNYTCPLGLKVLRQGGWGPSGLLFSHWFLAASSLSLAALFAFKRTWHYSLRTILVATTLLAAILGLAVYVV
jgi:hypothetical protein